MAIGDGKGWEFKDPERFGARFRSFYQCIRNMQLAEKSGATPSDIQAYGAVEPVAAARIRDLQTVERAQGIAAITGLLTISATVWRWSKSPPVVMTAMLISPFASAVVAEDIGSLALGTFKYDATREVEKFHEWVIERNAAKKEE